MRIVTAIGKVVLAIIIAWAGNELAKPGYGRIGDFLKLKVPKRAGGTSKPFAKRHVILPEQTLSKIALIFYKDASYSSLLWYFNRSQIGDNPDALKAGHNLEIPPLSAFTPEIRHAARVALAELNPKFDDGPDAGVQHLCGTAPETEKKDH